MERLKRRRLHLERLVQTAHERLHALARADDDAGGGAGLGLEEPAGCEGGCFHEKAIVSGSIWNGRKGVGVRGLDLGAYLLFGSLR